MKILITTDWSKPVINGVVTSVQNLEQALRRLGHEVRILTLSQTRHSYASQNVTYIGSLPVGKIYPQARIKLPFQNPLLTDIISWKPDIIHSQCEFSTFFFARQLAKILSIPLVHTYHTVYEDYTHYFSPNRKWGRKAVCQFTRWVANSCDAMLAPTEKVKHILNGYDVHCPIFVVPTGISLERFTQPYTDAACKLREQFGWDKNDFVCVSVGRLAKEKNTQELIRLHAAIRHPHLRLLLVGNGPERESLKHLANAYGISNQVQFTGMIPPQEIAAYYQCGTVFVSASTSETQGLTYIEALASGLPVICRKDPCLDGVVIDNWNGFSYTSDDAYCQMIRLLLENPYLCSHMGEHAAYSAQTYSCETFARSVEQIYRTVSIKARSASPQKRFSPTILKGSGIL